MRCTGCAIAWSNCHYEHGESIFISKETLRNKVRDGWAGPTIEVAFSWPTDFKYQGTFIQNF